VVRVHNQPPSQQGGPGQGNKSAIGKWRSEIRARLLARFGTTTNKRQRKLAQAAASKNAGKTSTPAQAQAQSSAQSLAAQTGTRFINLAEAPADPVLARLVPEPFARQHTVFPYRLNGGVLELLVRDPREQAVMADIEFVTSLRILPVVTTEAEILQLIGATFG
jgi:Type II secretion system (T2SS), protein E, N-terminal domain